ncbi:hypothetical protein [Amycolatopsis sp. NPDC021455]|uniref:hypothetical protein n=1 Tax=Amycolatopsis sp. NPDC021455 TaxID=3154901 RepID=UPI0033FBDA59
MTRTGFYAGLGFTLFMIGLFIWTMCGQVFWAALGAGAMGFCFVRSEQQREDEER